MPQDPTQCDGCHKTTTDYCRDEYCRPCHKTESLEDCLANVQVNAIRKEAGLGPVAVE